MEKIYTCQICERAIKAKSFLYMGKPTTGVIAHHGYQRPWKAGWQSGSCFGARHLPYEISCDALGPAIQRCKAFIKSQKIHLEDFIKNPPEKLLEFDQRHRQEEILKPAGYVYEENRGSFSRDDTYALKHHNTIYQIKQSIKHAENELPRLEKRLAEWVKKE